METLFTIVVFCEGALLVNSMCTFGIFFDVRLKNDVFGKSSDSVQRAIYKISFLDVS